jgi:hypothetical protein
MRKQTYKTPLTKQDINENRQSISAPPYRTGMLFVDQDAISVGDGFEHLNSGLGLLVVLI